MWPSNNKSCFLLSVNVIYQNIRMLFVMCCVIARKLLMTKLQHQLVPLHTITLYTCTQTNVDIMTLWIDSEICRDQNTISNCYAPGWMDSRGTNTSVTGCTSAEDASVLASDDDDNVLSVAAAATGLVIWFIGILFWELQQWYTSHNGYGCLSRLVTSKWLSNRNTIYTKN